jgi:hypothetical protein
MLEILIELLIQIACEVIINSAMHLYVEGRKDSGPVLAGIAYGVVGAGLGLVSLLALPRPVFAAPGSQIMALIGATIVMGLCASALGFWRRRRGRATLRIDQFVFGAILGFFFGFMRFVAL